MISVQLENLFEISQWEKLFTNHFFTANLWINVLDIIVVWYLLYQLIKLVRGTKAVQVVKGIAVIVAIRVISGWIGLNTVSWLMNQVITYGVIAGIVIFQPEVRRGLEKLGRGAPFKKSKRAANNENTMIQGLDHAIQYMSKRKIGALITIERKTGLEEYIETGIALDADITGELLINIFIPNTPLHDGAVIIKDEKIAVACAYLPLSESTLIPKEFGTRHRAAVGISEVGDALTIVVSEETGDVSLTLNNELLPHLTQEEYLKILTDELTQEVEEPRETFMQQFLEGFTKGGKK